jgi:hypothetical protein
MMDGFGHEPGWHVAQAERRAARQDPGHERAASIKRWELMGRMHEQGLRARENSATGKLDDAA